MRGFLSYLILWILSKKSMPGSQIAEELARRRGSKPSPGTIYPALKELKGKGLIKADKNKVYSLTRKGEKDLNEACAFFTKAFFDAREMFNCCSGTMKKSDCCK